MPRPRMTEQQQREKALQRAVARAKVDVALPRDQDVAHAVGMGQSAYSKRKQDLYHGFGFDRASQLARHLHLTGREVCEIIGVPYTPEGEKA